jgi:hypothetical protein
MLKFSFEGFIFFVLIFVYIFVYEINFNILQFIYGYAQKTKSAALVAHLWLKCEILTFKM